MYTFIDRTLKNEVIGSNREKAQAVAHGLVGRWVLGILVRVMFEDTPFGVQKFQFLSTLLYL